MIRTIPNRPSTARRGGALLIAIVLLFVASLIGATLLQMAFTQRRQQQHDRLRVQAGWLAEAGLQRGLQRALSEPDYRGESWSLEVPGRSEAKPGDVEITVTAATPRTVTVVATYPREMPFRARVRRTLNLPSQP